METSKQENWLCNIELRLVVATARHPGTKAHTDDPLRKARSHVEDPPQLLLSRIAPASADLETAKFSLVSPPSSLLVLQRLARKIDAKVRSERKIANANKDPSI